MELRGIVRAALLIAAAVVASAQSAVTDTAELINVSDFSLFGYSTEGAHVNLFINAKTKDSVVTVTYYFETGQEQSRFVFNKKLIDAESIGEHYDMQKFHELQVVEVAKTERTTLKDSKKAAEWLTKKFSEIREELSKRAPIRQGFVYLDKGDNEKAPSYYDSAVEEFNRALRLDSLSAEAYAGRGRAYLRKGDNKQAVADFSRALRLDSHNAIVLSNRGRAYARMGDYDKAVADFEAAAKIDPDNKLIKQNL